MQKKLKSRKGFTLVELMVVLVIMALLATLIGAGIISYIRTARFNKNETNARTVFQTAQTALTRLQAGGGDENYLQQVKTNGVSDIYYTVPENFNSDGNIDNPDGATLWDKMTPDEITAKLDDIHRNVYALFYDKNNPTSASAKLVTQLLGNYVYDETLMDASICLEIDANSGEVFAVFYDSNSEAFSFTEPDSDSVTNIKDRSFGHRADDSLVGYYSVDDLVNVVTLDAKQLKIQTLTLINKEALTLNWKSNAANENLVSYTVTLYGKKTGASVDPLVDIVVDIGKAQEPGGTPFNNQSSQAVLTVYKYSAGASEPDTDHPYTYTFPLSCKNNNYTLTLDAMMSADLLQVAKDATGDTGDANLFSITRLLRTATNGSPDIPDEVYAEVTAKPCEGGTGFAASKAKTSNTEHPLFGTGAENLGGTSGIVGNLTYYRHLYNMRWLASDAVGTFTLQPETANNGVLKWADSKNGSSVVVYEQKDGKIQSATPKLDAPVAFPTVAVLPGGVTLNGNGKTLANLQLRTESVSKDEPAAGKEHYAKYVGMFGHNYGTVSNLVLQDVDAVVNLVGFKTEVSVTNKETALTNAVKALQEGTYEESTTTFGTDTEKAPLTALRGVGALCGINTGIVQNVSMTQSETTATSRVVAVVPFNNTFTTGQGETTDTYAISDNLTTVTSLSVRGIGGIVGISRPKVDGELQPTAAKKYELTGLTVTGEVGGLLLDKNPTVGTAVNTEAAELDEYKAAQAANDTYKPLGIGGVAGMVVATADMGRDSAAGSTARALNITAETSVYGNGYTGGVFGNLLAKEVPTGTPVAPAATYTTVSATGRVTATADYEPTKGTTLGRFFGGVAGYMAYIGLDNCSSATSTDTPLTMAEVKADVKLAQTKLLKGDFVGGIAGFADNSTLTSCTSGSKAGLTTNDTVSKSNTFVLGKKFIGGLVGGSNKTTLTKGDNYAFVLGQKYVGGAAAVNVGGGAVTELTNHAPVGAVQLGTAANAEKTAFVGGIVGYNGYGDTTTATPATITGCSSSVIDNSRLYSKFLTDVKADTADFVGGIAGYNAGKIDMGTSPTVVLVGRNFVGGIAGANAKTAEITSSVASGEFLTVSGSIIGNLGTGGAVGYNRGSELPSALGFTGSTLQGYRFVGGVVGANLPEGSFAFEGTGAVFAEGVGSISGDAVVGGIIGYNQLLATGGYPAQTTAQTLAEYYESLLPTFAAGTGAEDGILREKNASAGSMGTLSTLSNSVGINANAYAGGIIGYNAETTTLELKECTNTGSISRIDSAYTVPVGSTNTTLAAGASVNGYLANRGYAKSLDTDTNANFIGGIAGINTQYMTLTKCTNTGAINGSANVLGGITGLNEGIIDTCTNTSNLGSSQQNYIGGIAGINAKKDNTSTTQGLIINSSANGTVTGGDEVGGLVGANLWNASVAIKNLSVTVKGKTDVGGAIGLNYSLVTGTAGEDTVASGTVNATGANAGGIVGHNMPEGTIDTVQVGGGVTVSGTSTNGGIVGLNEGTIGAAPASGSYNVVSKAAAVSATQSYAGGITGRNMGTIRYAAYDNAGGNISTTLSYAGGIAGANEAGATIDHSELKAGAVTANNGVAGGIAATNAGTITECTVSGGSITDKCTDAQGVLTIGAVAATNSGRITNSSMTSSVTLTSATATSAGSIVGNNEGAVTDCTVTDMPTLTLSASSINVGGAVGYNSKDGTVKNTGVNAGIPAANTYTNLGGVVGSNDGTLNTCTYQGTWIGADITTVNNTAGGIAGNNGGTLKGCTVKAITLRAIGATNVNSTMTADVKLTNATHIGGVAGRNNAGATIDGCTVAGSSTNTSMVTAKNGFVGGVAGSNAGSIKNSGGASAYTAGGTTTKTLDMMQTINSWTSTTNASGNPKTTEQKNNDLNAMIRVLTNSNKANDDEKKLATAYAAIKGVDTVSTEGKGYNKVYIAGENGNDLLLALTGGGTASNMANGYLGGITGFNTVSGSVQNSATGKWFVYSDNATMDSTIGGAIGQNESNAELSGILNCAAVRRYTRGGFTPVGGAAIETNDDDKNINNERKTGYDNGNSANAAHVGGVIGYQQNRTGGDWAVTGLVNCGTVFNSRSNNVGGVIAYWQNNGGTVQRCYNFGNLTTNMNDGNSSGGVGGIVGYYDKPTNGIDTSILSCQNHGNIYRKNKGANDVAGIVGRVSIGASSDTMTINVSDCVNGNVTLQANSMACGIFGYMGPLGTQLDGIAVNIDRCRNFCTAFEAGANAGIVGDRSSDGRQTVASTTVTNCFALYQPVTITGNPSADNNNPIARSNSTRENLHGSGNYYMDANSFDDAYIGSGLKNMNRSIKPITSSVTATLNGVNIDNATVNGAHITSDEVKAAWFDGVQDNVYIPRTGNALKVIIKADLAVPVALKSIKLYFNNSTGAWVTGYDYTITVTADDNTSATGTYCINQPVDISALTDIAGKKITSFEVKVDWTSFTGRNDFQICEIELVSAEGASINYSDRNDGTNNAGESAASGTYGGNKQFTDTRLYAGIDNGADNGTDAPNYYTYFAANLAKDTNGVATKVVTLLPYNSKVDSADFKAPTVQRGINDKNGALKATLPLLYNDNDGDGKLTIHDVVDETIQDYYANILDAAALGAPLNPAINFSGAGASTSVYGRYEVKWDKPASGTPQYYEVNIYLEGGTLLKTASAYNTAYTFDVPVEWKDSGYLGKNIYATVTAVNSKSTDADKAARTATSPNATLAQPLPTPKLRVEYTLDAKRVVSLVNIADYTALSNDPANPYTDWEVDVELLNVASAVASEATITKDTPTVEFAAGANGTYTLRAYADVPEATPSQKYFRSELMSQSIFIPQWYPEDNTVHHVLSDSGVTVTGSNAADLTITANVRYKLNSISPMYHVALIGVAKNGAGVTDAAHGYDLTNQYITLAYKDVLLTEGDNLVTFTAADLPANMLDKYTSFEVLAEPSTSGLGDYYYFHDLTADELTTLATEKGLGATPAAAIRGFGYEIIANADGTYAYRSAHALLQSELNFVNKWWFLHKTLPITTLDAPILNALADTQPSVTDTDMTYTFTWTAPTDVAPLAVAKYTPTMTGIVYERNTDGTIKSPAVIASEVPIDVSAYTDNTANSLTLNAGDWHYDEVRLTVARLGDDTGTTKYIGKTVSYVYSVKQRLAQLTAPTATLTDVDHRDLRYTITWDAPADADKVKDYTITVVNTTDTADKKTFTTTGTDTTFDADLEAFAGKSVQFYVVSNPNDASAGAYVRAPAGITLPLNVPTRYATPVISSTELSVNNTAITDNTVTTSEFKSKLSAVVNLDSGTTPLAGNYLFKGYFFDDATAAANAATAINAGNEPDASTYQDKFGDSGAVMTANGNRLTISLAGISTDNTGRYMVMCLRAAPSSGIASNWVAVQNTETLPQIKLDAPTIAPDSTAPTTQTATLTVSGVPLTDTTDLTFQQYTVEWGKTELATGYTVALVPLQESGADKYAPTSVAIEIAQQDVIDDVTDPEHPVVTTPAGSITKVTKTVQLNEVKDTSNNVVQAAADVTIEIPATVDGSYDLSISIKLGDDGVAQKDENGNYVLISQPVEFTGHILYNNGAPLNAEYRFEMVPTLTYDAATGTYRVALPDNATPITDEDTTSIHHNTGTVKVQALGDATKHLNPSEPTEVVIYDPGTGLFSLSAPAPEPTATPAPAATAIPVPAATATPAPTTTATPVPAATATPVPAATATPVPAATATPEPTATAIPEPTATATPAPTATATLAPTATATPEPAATATPEPAATATPEP